MTDLKLNRSISIGLACLFWCAQFARCNVRLAGIFGDHMVLQQGVKLPIWGWADPGETVKVATGATSATVVAGKDGNWRVDLAPMQAIAEPIKLTVAGKNTLVLNDVLVGEVWLASGQSNMQFSLRASANSADALANADNPKIRLCSMGNNPSLTPVTDRIVKWSPCTAGSAKSFSAVAYFFGKDLHDNLKVPVGLVGAYVAGTPAQSWANLEALQTSPELKHYVDDLAEARSKSPTTRDSSKVNAGVPTSLYNGMIAPLRHFAMKGVIWYQGESNTGNAVEYRTLFPALIDGWRQQWDAPDRPFLFVQLPGFGRRTPEPGPSDWAMLREAQALALKLPHTGMAVTIDLSAPRALLHPKNKLNVGRRLALTARRVAYGQTIDASGPSFQSMQVEGDTIRIQFADAQDGLMLDAAPTDKPTPPTTRPTELTGFEIAGADRSFVAADARIDGNSVMVRSDQIKKPVAVRYGWADNPAVDLYNKSGLPAAPFRTDNWDN